MFYLYRFLNDENEILYVGKTKQSLSDRFYAHCHLPEECYNKTKKIECTLCKTESDLHIYENYYINKFKPTYNTDSKYDDELTIILPELIWNTYEEGEKYCKSLRHSTCMYKQEKDEKYIKNNIENFLYENLGNVMLKREDREELVNIINARKNGKQLKKIEYLNDYLVKMDIPYQIIKFATSRSKNGERTKYKNAWRIERTTT